MIRNYIVVAFCIISLALQAQETENSFVEEYSRNALTVFVVGGNSSFSSDILGAANGVIIPDKFDDNNLSIRKLESKTGNGNIYKELKEEKIANQIIAKWFARDSVTGQMNMSVIHERGMYNASDADIQQASTTKVGIAKLKDAGESLIDRSYVLVMEFYDIESMRQIYNKRDVAKRAAAEALNKNYTPVNRVKNGWVGQVHGYLYKLEVNDSLVDLFYNNLWIYEEDSDEVRQSKKQAFELANLPIKYLGEADLSADGTQYNAGHPLAGPRQLSRDELFQRMLNSGLSSCVFQMERLVENFKVKAPIYNVKPVRAKIGKKEGLKTDQRYFAMESYQNEKGETINKRKGVVRAAKVIDNREVATGKSDAMSAFYQTAGSKIQPGMVLHQRNDFGIGLSGGIAIGEIAGGWGKIEYNVSRATGLPTTQLKLFAYMGIENKHYTMNQSWLVNDAYDFYFNRIQIGLSKGFYFARKFSLAPFVAYGAETGQNKRFNADNNLKNDDFIGTDFLNFGGYLTLNVLHNIQILGSFNYYTPLWYTYTKQRSIFDISNYESRSYTDWFEGRRNMSIDLGLRIEF